MDEYFLDAQHRKHFNDLLSNDDTSLYDTERLAMFFILSGNAALYRHVNEIYNFRSHMLKSNTISKLGYLCNSALSLLRLSINLYNGRHFRGSDPCNLLSCLDHDNLQLALDAMKIRFQ